MGLFGKKKEAAAAGRIKNSSVSTMPQAEHAASEHAAIKVLGGGCAKCHELEANVTAALKDLGMHTEIELVTDFTKIAAYGVMTTPALVLHEKVISYGKVLKKDEVITLLKENL